LDLDEASFDAGDGGGQRACEHETVTTPDERDASVGRGDDC
jgi:hypothetical protein